MTTNTNTTNNAAAAGSRRPIVALDLEGTLISNAISQFPRPGLHQFLTHLKQLDIDLAVYTAVSRPRARHIMQQLAAAEDTPGWFAQLPLHTTDTTTKDLTAIDDDPTRVWLIDDQPAVAHPDQTNHVIIIEAFDPPYPDTDTALAELLTQLPAELRQATT